MIMLLRRPSVDISLRGKRFPFFLGGPEFTNHCASIDVFRQTEINASTLFRVEQVIALVLRVWNAELFLNVLGERMNLQRQIAALPRIEEIETDRELSSESPVDRFAKQLVRMAKHKVHRGGFDSHIAKPE